MSNTVTIGMPPCFWLIERPQLVWNIFDVERFENLLLEDGFHISQKEVWPLSSASLIVASHSEEGAMTLFVLKYNEILQQIGLKITPHRHNTRRDNRVKDGNVRTL